MRNCPRNFSALIIFLLLFFIGQGSGGSLRSSPVSAQSEYEKIELTNPLRLQPIIAIPYESTLKVIIHFRLPELLAGGEDLTASAMKQVMEEYRLQLVHSAKQRFPVNSVMSKTSNYIVGTDEQMQSYLQILGDNNIPGFSVYTLNSTDLGDDLQDKFASMVDEVLADSNLRGTSLDAAPVTAVLAITNMLLNYIRGVANACLNHEVPSSLLTSYLQDKLLNFIMDHNLIDPSYKPTFSLDNFGQILSQATSDCLLTSSRLYVVVNIPLVRRQAKWQIFKAHHSKFMYDQRVCSAGPDEPLLYAFDLNTESIVELDDTLGATCKLDTATSLCFIPHVVPSKASGDDGTKGSKSGSISKDADSMSCATGLLNKLSVKELKDLCEFRCKGIEDDDYFIEEISENELLLTNVKNVQVVCPTYNVSKKFETIGALKIRIQPADCYLWADNEFISFPSRAQRDKFETSSMPTAHHMHSKSPVEISYLLPLTWTKNNAYSMFTEENISFKIKDYKEIIDFEWLKKFEEEQDQEEGKHWNFFDDDYIE